jgi:hypothetical protein
MHKTEETKVRKRKDERKTSAGRRRFSLALRAHHKFGLISRHRASLSERRNGANRKLRSRSAGGLAQDSRSVQEY